MFRLEKKFRFEAAHRLPNHDGKCRRLHGHSWVGTVIVEAPHVRGSGPKDGMVVDFADLSALLRPLVEDYLDHHYLNESLEMASPTSERVAEWVFRRLGPVIHDPGRAVRLVAVRIEETCTSAAEYRSDE